MRHRGFTAVELIIVMSIMILLVGLAAPTVFASLRSSQVQRGAALIGNIARQAQACALQGLAPSTGETYGIAVVDDPADGNAPYAALIYGTPNSTGRMRDLWFSDGRTRIIERLPSAVSVRVAGNALRGQAVKEVVWFYNWRTGTPLAPTGTGFSTGQASVGLKSMSFADVFGITSYTVTAPVVAPSTSTDPGLEVASGDGKIRRGLQVYPSGLFEYVNIGTR
jgi:type II secretory pathway pseudopilin PulG